jgi:bifunctional DNA-binding transcriptional regulator/antitoxin component of YhaV-PrlF toxin-antitoxin module
LNEVNQNTFNSKVYKGFQTVIPNKIRKELDINIEDTLNWKIEGEYMIVKVNKQKSLRDLEKFSISLNESTDSVDLKKRSGRGEF